MHRQGRSAAIALFPVVALWFACSGCTHESSGQFHSYQPGKAVAENDSAAPTESAKEKSAIPQSTKPAGPTAQEKSQEPAAKPSDATGSSVQGTRVAMAPVQSSDPKNARPAPASSASTGGSASPAGRGTGGSASASLASKGQPHKVQLLVANKSFRPEGKEGALRVSYDDLDLLKVLNMDPVTPDAPDLMPAWLKGLEGRRIRIRGFMYPTFQQTGVHVFGLARDNQICCFGRNPKIYDVFDVVLREGNTTDYIPNRPFDVVGVFHIHPESEDGKLYRLYEMDDASVITK
jgi:hypothetical protein